MRTILSSRNHLVAAALVTMVAGCSGNDNGNPNPEASNVGGRSSPAGGATTSSKTSGNSAGGTSSTSPSAGGSSATSTASGGASTASKAVGGNANGGSAAGGKPASGNAIGGAANGGTSAGSKAATGGKAAGGGSPNSGAATAGAATGGGKAAAGGGSPSGGAATAGAATSGSANGGAAGKSSNAGPTAGSGTSGGAVPSKGCGKTDGAKALTTGGSSVSGALPTSVRLKVTSGGKSRDVIVDIPTDYDPNKPYRLIFSWRQMGGSSTGNATGLHPAGDGPNFDAQHYAYFGLHREATNANQPAIFVAPDTDPIGGNWDWAKDSVYFDDLFTLVTSNLCIDESRVFATGFSFGAMMSYALSVGRATKLRGVVTMAPANYNFTQPSNDHAPIAYMSATGMSDGTCPWGDDSRGGKACVIQHAKDNGCTVPGTFTTATVGSKKYVCYDFEGCKPGYPVKVCTFDGGHTPSSIDDGSSTGDDGLKAFIPPIAWKFMAQL